MPTLKQPTLKLTQRLKLNNCFGLTLNTGMVSLPIY